MNANPMDRVGPRVFGVHLRRRPATFRAIVQLEPIRLHRFGKGLATRLRTREQCTVAGNIRAHVPEVVALGLSYLPAILFFNEIASGAENVALQLPNLGLVFADDRLYDISYR